MNRKLQGTRNSRYDVGNWRFFRDEDWKVHTDTHRNRINPLDQSEWFKLCIDEKYMNLTKNDQFGIFMRIVVCLDLVSGSKQIKVHRYVKKSIYISHYLHNLMKFSLHNLLDFGFNDVISKLGPTDSYDQGFTNQNLLVRSWHLEWNGPGPGKNWEIEDLFGPGPSKILKPGKFLGTLLNGELTQCSQLLYL